MLFSEGKHPPHRVKSMTSLGYLANEAKRSGRIIGEDGEYLIVAIHRDVFARRRQQQRDSLRVRRAKARAAYAESIGRMGGNESPSS